MIGNCVRIHGVVAAVPGGFGRFSSAPEDGRHHTADLAALLGSGLIRLRRLRFHSLALPAAISLPA